MVLQTVIKLRSESVQLGQVVPGNARQIVMLIVVTHVETNSIDRAVITVGLLVGIIGIMLLDPTRAYWMKSDREEERKSQIKQARPPAEVNDTDIIQDSGGQIH